MSSPSYAHRRKHWTSYSPELRKGRSGRPYRTWREQVLKPPVLYCCRCGRVIDKSLSGNDRWGPTADHYPVPLAMMGVLGLDPLDPRNGAPAHRRCNLSHQPRRSKINSLSRVVTSQRVADRRW